MQEVEDISFGIEDCLYEASDGISDSDSENLRGGDEGAS